MFAHVLLNFLVPFFTNHFKLCLFLCFLLFSQLSELVKSVIAYLIIFWTDFSTYFILKVLELNLHHPIFHPLLAFHFNQNAFFMKIKDEQNLPFIITLYTLNIFNTYLETNIVSSGLDNHFVVNIGGLIIRENSCGVRDL